ncbi:hypothetical protein IWW50_000796 [Coemansia erecta]|nr:hypothetical protein GGF43_000555 [Coemansia sp. RSA 2618]KAJ2829527.1 hypothetical protein IWW50_000796 [Coemansia erecta]
MQSHNIALLLARAPTTRHYRLKLDGLFGSTQIQHGNNKPKSLHKTRRTWLPNIQKVTLFSSLLNTKMRINLTTRVLRTIDKKGGLDNYLLETKDKNINSEFGLRIKQQLLEAQQAKLK